MLNINAKIKRLIIEDENGNVTYFKSDKGGIILKSIGYKMGHYPHSSGQYLIPYLNGNFVIDFQANFLESFTYLKDNVPDGLLPSDES